MTEFSLTKFESLKIDLSYKHIKALTPGLPVCEDVQSLYLHNNNLQDLPEDVGDLKSLKVLSLDNNKFKALPKCIFKIKTLTELTAKFNSIRTVDSQVGDLFDLNTLDVSHNEIVSISPGIGFLGCLTHVNLSNNRLKKIPHELTALCGLVELDISCNSITKLPCVRNLIHLKTFNASHNHLYNLPDFSQCRELVCLDLSYNALEDIASANLNCHPFLKEVYLQYNRLTNLPDDFCHLTSIRELNLGGNMLFKWFGDAEDEGEEDYY